MKLPDGGCTSIRSPGRTSRTSQPDSAPPGTSRTPIRGGWPAGEQIEYDRRSSRPSTIRRSVSDWPGRNRYTSASSAGTSKVTATASSQSLSIRATVSSWNCARPALVASSAIAVTSDLLDVLERLGAGPAPVQVLARRPAERGGALRVGRPAGRAFDSRAGREERQRHRTSRRLQAGTGVARCQPRPACGGLPALIRSVDHGGLSTVRTSTSANPAAASRAATIAPLSRASPGSRSRSASATRRRARRPR